MIKTNIKGNALSQYSIIIILVGLALVPIFYMFGSKLVENFTSFYTVLKGSDSGNTAVTPSVNPPVLLKAGSLGGTPKNPVSKCDNGQCNIDFGEYLLSGIPENFTDFIQEKGTSNSTDKIASIFNQIADQLQEKGDTKGSQEYRDLANLGHFIAQLQRKVEETATNCKSNANPLTCLKSQSNVPMKDLGITLPDSLSSILKQYNPGNQLRTEILYTDLGYVKSQEMDKSSSSFDMGTDNYPGFAMLKTFNSIMNNSKYSDTLKGTTAQLMQNIDFLTQNQKSKLAAIDFMNINTTVSWPTNDIITGDVIDQHPLSELKTTLSGGIDAILHPEVSRGTDLNAMLLCAAGKNKTSGYKCY